MALYNYDHNFQRRKKVPEYSVMRVSYQNIHKSIYFNLEPEFRYIVRFTFVTLNLDIDIKKRNDQLRNLINKKATKAHIPMSGVRFISVHHNGYVVYNIVLDKLLSAIWLLSQLADIERIEEFSWMQREKKHWTKPETVSIFNSQKQKFFNQVKRVFQENKDVSAVEVDNIGLFIDSTGREPQDFDPFNLMAWYGTKPRYRAMQYFGRLSGNHRPRLKQ